MNVQHANQWVMFSEITHWISEIKLYTEKRLILFTPAKSMKKRYASINKLFLTKHFMLYNTLILACFYSLKQSVETDWRDKLNATQTSS